MNASAILEASVIENTGFGEGEVVALEGDTLVMGGCGCGCPPCLDCTTQSNGEASASALNALMP